MWFSVQSLSLSFFSFCFSWCLGVLVVIFSLFSKVSAYV